MDKRLVFSIDYDETYTADPITFRALISLLLGLGHTVVMVTGREDIPGFNEQPRDAMASFNDVLEDGVHVIFAGGRWKDVAAREAGYVVDVWIDDNPTYIKPPQTLRETLADLRKYNHPAIKPSHCKC